MKLIKKITAQPWLPEAGPVAELETASLPPAKVGLWVLLAVITSLFLLLILAYLTRAQLDDWQALAGEAWQPLSNPWPLWLNTALLLASSLALQGARMAARRGHRRGLEAGLLVGGVLALAFLVGQLWVWQQLRALGYYVASNPANSFFFLLTGLHGLHLLGGLLAWGRVIQQVWRAAPTQQVRLRVELCSLYWHFLLLVWLALLALLTSPQSTLDALSTLCGLR